MTMAEFKNKAFQRYAQIYEDIAADFYQQAAGYGLAFGPDEREASERLRQGLAAQGIQADNAGKSLFYGRRSPACEACREGQYSITLYTSLMCHRHCYYCFNPNQEQYTYFSAHKKNAAEELAAFHRSGRQLQQIALSGGEPLLHKEECLRYFRTAKQLYPQSRRRLYTSGDLLDEAMAAALAEAGLQEIRFSIKLEDSQELREKVYAAIALARRYIPCVYVEMPVIPGTEAEMQALLLRLAELKIAGINLLEFCFPYHGEEEFRRRGFQLKMPQFRVFYDYWYAGGLAIAGSELLAMELLAFAAERQLPFCVHYCSLENKHTAQIYEQNHYFSQNSFFYFSTQDFFLKTAKVFGTDIDHILAVFRKKHVTDFQQNDLYLEFPVRYLSLLLHSGTEPGIASYVVEKREDGEYLREVAIEPADMQQAELAEFSSKVL